MIDVARVLQDALEAYAAAQERLELVEQAWRAADCPIVVTHSNGTQGADPLWRALQDQEAHCERLRQPLLRRGHAGGGAQSFLTRAAQEAGIDGDSLSPAAQLRSLRVIEAPGSASGSLSS